VVLAASLLFFATLGLGALRQRATRSPRS
jgi:hypothetical protein